MKHGHCNEPTYLKLEARTFPYEAATLWNSLPIEIHATDNIESFKWILKTHLFKLAYGILQ